MGIFPWLVCCCVTLAWADVTGTCIQIGRFTSNRGCSMNLQHCRADFGRCDSAYAAHFQKQLVVTPTLLTSELPRGVGKSAQDMLSTWGNEGYMDTLRAPPKTWQSAVKRTPDWNQPGFLLLIQVLTMIAVMTFKAGELSVVEYGCNELLACVRGPQTGVWNWIRKGHHSGIGFLGPKNWQWVFIKMFPKAWVFLDVKWLKTWIISFESFRNRHFGPVSWRPCFSFMASICLALKLSEKTLSRSKVRLESKFAQVFLLITRYPNQLGKFLEFQPDQHTSMCGTNSGKFLRFSLDKIPSLDVYMAKYRFFSSQ